MAKAEHQPLSYLTDRGRKIFRDIVNHIIDSDLDSKIDPYELSMLANSFDVYERAADVINKEGFSNPATNNKNGKYDQMRPEYSIMKNEYSNILKHAPKYGLNPGDRAKIFGGMKKKKKDDLNAGLE